MTEEPATEDQSAQTDIATADSDRAAEDARRVSRGGLSRPMVALKTAHFADRTVIERTADFLIRTASSTPFLVAHLIWFTSWIAWNTGILGVSAIDPFPFGLLTLIVSLEAIFLAIFMLIGQSREAAIAELREELMLQISLRMEAEVTKNLQLVAGLYTRLGFRFSEEDELREMLQTLDATSMERDLLEQIGRLSRRG
jgi:uncharacterized membrane protein